MPVEDLRSELDFLELDVKGLNKPALQKALIKVVLPTLGADAQTKSASIWRDLLNLDKLMLKNGK